jgi:small subunit ribosomal protein S21
VHKLFRFAFTVLYFAVYNGPYYQGKKSKKYFQISVRGFIFASAKNRNMLIIEVKDSENIDRALKRYKRKVQQTKILRELRDRKEFKKPSVQRRNQILKAIYKEKKGRDMGV